MKEGFSGELFIFAIDKGTDIAGVIVAFMNHDFEGADGAMDTVYGEVKGPTGGMAEAVLAVVSSSVHGFSPLLPLFGEK